MKILVVEDEQGLREAIRASLKKEGFLVETAEDFHVASEKVFVYAYDCILLDIMLPHGSGLDLLEELQQAGKSENVIVISAKNSVEDKVRGLALGADDYLTKPFHLAELNARVKAVLRRNTLGGKEEVAWANVRMDLDNRLVFIGDRPTDLNRKEFDTLQYFLLNPNRLVTRTALAEYVWGDHIDQSDNFDFIYSQIKNIRRKLKQGAAAVRIQTVYGVGYKLIHR
ncbi:response regulator transcription factor [Lewinella sp. IMCC34183]|uniref:response regulator transcription factor n=1 Tax=Lewinella sp. IMCC34183 TaxID=2248762 RepID=UPI000E25EC82|nr:response regulator transcription factor [Lewinella sp. IMCC34183]